jgi:hypothetical protein
MGNKMTHQSRAELANAIRARYRSGSGGQKRKILDLAPRSHSAVDLQDAGPHPRRWLRSDSVSPAGDIAGEATLRSAPFAARAARQ